MSDILALVEQAARDPRFLAQLQQDPFGTARAAGVSASPDELRQLVGGAGAPAAEVLQGRLSFSTKSQPKCPDGGNLCNFGYAGAGSMY
jgi:hypothetical protein